MYQYNINLIETKQVVLNITAPGWNYHAPTLLQSSLTFSFSLKLRIKGSLPLQVGIVCYDLASNISKDYIQNLTLMDNANI
jgi:hypothetical protein